MTTQGIDRFKSGWFADPKGTYTDGFMKTSTRNPHTVEPPTLTTQELAHPLKYPIIITNQKSKSN